VPSLRDIDAETESYTRKTHIKTPVLDHQERRKWFEYGAQGLPTQTATPSRLVLFTCIQVAKPQILERTRHLDGQSCYTHVSGSFLEP